MSDPNPELLLAEAFVEQTNCTVFLTGKAGTGKTTFLHAIKKQTHKRLVVTAPTGVAAINAGGVTLHSFFQLPFGPFLPGSEVHNGQHRFSREKKNIIKSLDLLVIDEISMVRADLLDGVDSVLRRYRRSELPFGGVQLLMIGDLHQLSPVVKEAEWQLLRGLYDSPYFFSSQALRRIELVSIELQRIYRQADSNFIDLLNRVRTNQLDSETLARINVRYLPDFSPQDNEGYITLCTHNRSADTINAAKLRTLSARSRSFEALVEGVFPEHTFPNAATLELKVGAQVMFVRNDMTPEKRYFNGKIGKVTGISDEAIEVTCPGEAGTIEVGPVSWENIEYTVDPETTEISQKIIGTFKQFPLKPAWAITIHKSQGLTFDKAVIDAQDAFAFGQVYVALSRCRTFEGLVLSSPLRPQAVKTDATVLQFVAKVENNPPTPQQLEQAKIRYQQQLLLECFDFAQLQRHLGRLLGLLRGNASIIALQASGDIYMIGQQTLETICQVGDNFKRQLQGLFSTHVAPVSDGIILERLTKASSYFSDKLQTLLLPCLQTLEVETDNKEVRKKITDVLKQFREEAAVKLAAVQSCADGFSPAQYLRALSAAAFIHAEKKSAKTTGPSYSEADVGHPELFQQLRDWRARKAEAQGVPAFQILHQKPLVQIAVHLPDSLASLKEIKGIGARLAEKYGGELVAMVAEYRREHSIATVTLPKTTAITPAAPNTMGVVRREDSKKISLELLQQGHSIDEIAEARGLVRQTIEGHLAYYIKTGELAIAGLIAEARQREIEEQIQGMGLGSLKGVKAALGEDYSYGEINLVLAHLQRLETL